jgi:hypothetical protein
MKKKLFRIALILFGIGCLSAIGTYMYVFHKPHRNIEKEQAAFIIDAQILFEEFVKDEDASYEKYGNQVLEITGEIVDISINDNSSSLILLDEMEGINCSFDSLYTQKFKETLESLTLGKKIKIKGQCDGYDMIMGVVITRCILAK